VRSNIEFGNTEDLIFDGVEVDDNNEPAIKNAGPPPEGQTAAGQWIKPSICPRRSSNMTNSPGAWSKKSWNEIADMDEFALFWMAFLENFFCEVLIPTTNKNFPGDDLTVRILCLVGYQNVDWVLWWNFRLA